MEGPEEFSVWRIVWEPEVEVGVAVPLPATRFRGCCWFAMVVGMQEEVFFQGVVFQMAVSPGCRCEVRTGRLLSRDPSVLDFSAVRSVPASDVG